MKQLMTFQERCRKANEIKCYKCKSITYRQNSIITKTKRGKLVMVCQDCSEIMKRN